MSTLSQWSYVQARLQARHGERLREVDWRTLEGARSLDQFIERARASSLRRFTERLNARMSSHAIERVLRDGARGYVAEVASWVPAAWRPAVLWTSQFPELPIVAALLMGEGPKWAKQDAAYADFTETDPRRRAANIDRSPLAPLATSPAREAALPARWYAHWRSLWPQPSTADSGPLLDLVTTMKAHIERLERAGPQESSAPYRRELLQSLTRSFRRHGSKPAAVFSHLGLVALDLERLRGGLIRRRLFEPDHAKEAA